jgi:hypothetical protein
MAKPKAKSVSKKAAPKYPRQSLEKSLRIPKAILDQNAGKDCTDEESATFLGMKYNTGPYATELSSALKYGLLERPAPGRVSVTATAKKILWPQNEQQELQGLREAAMKAPDISSVYSHYRGENLPDDQFLDNALVDKFRIPKEKVPEFKSVLFETLNKAKLLEEHNGRDRVLDVTGEVGIEGAASENLKRLEMAVTVGATDSCFVMMPFGAPFGELLRQDIQARNRKNRSEASAC